MQNRKNQKSNWEEVSNILRESQQGYFYNLWKYDIEKLNSEDKKHQAKSKSKYLGNEIFACCLIATILVISIGGSALIRNRTKQQLIYTTTPQTSSAIRQ